MRHATSPSLVWMTARRRKAGQLGERLAARHLERNGYQIIARNYRIRQGEMDLVATEDTTLVFCEVKTIVAREASTRGPAYTLEAVGNAKRRQLRRVARFWLTERSKQTPARGCVDIRFDAIGVLISTRGELLSLEHVRNAF
jgi:putative endonuclease